MTSNCPGIDPLPSEIHFFKIILDKTLQEGKIMIPKKFTGKYGASLSNPVFLKVPDGIEWQICWTKDGAGAVWLEKGWKEFVTYYSLGHGHLVLFKYQQTCTLEVHIFAASGVEINYPSNCTQNHSAQVLFEVIPTSSLPRPSKKLRTHSSRVVGQNSNSSQHVQVKVAQSQENTSGATKSETPSFMVVMKKSYAKGYLLVIPSIFAKRYLKENGRQDVLLQVMDGRTWHVQLKDGKFYHGWRDFASHNHLTVGDVCIFELTESQGLCFKVSIIPFSRDKCSTSEDKEDDDLVKIRDFRCINTFPIKAMQEAAKFTSRNPFFMINIRASVRGDCRPRVPLVFMRNHFNGKRSVMLRFGNKSWLVHLVGAVPTKLSEGWGQFAKECKLQPGNVCVFELINKEDVVLDVHIFSEQS